MISRYMSDIVSISSRCHLKWCFAYRRQSFTLNLAYNHKPFVKLQNGRFFIKQRFICENRRDSRIEKISTFVKETDPYRKWQ